MKILINIGSLKRIIPDCKNPAEGEMNRMSDERIQSTNDLTVWNPKVLY